MAPAKISVGIDVGTECIKVAVIDQQGRIRGSSIVARRGYFQDRVSEAYPRALEDAQVEAVDLLGVCATGFGENCVPMATMVCSDTVCHALGAFFHHPHAQCLVDIGGRDPKAIHIDGQGHPTAVKTLRRCAAGVGSFLIFAARHLDVHPSRLQEMANRTDEACDVGSYCSTFSGQDILEKMRDGVSRESIALGCINSVADRVLEIDTFDGAVVVSGGVVEYFPGVLKALSARTGDRVVAVPQPILTGAIGAAWWVFRQHNLTLSRAGEN